MSDKAGLMKQWRLLTPLLIVLQRAQLHLQRFCLYPPPLLCLLMHCPRLDLLLYIFRLLTTMQVLMKGVAAPPLRLTSGVAVVTTPHGWNYEHNDLLLGMICNLDGGNHAQLNQHNDNHPSNDQAKHHIRHHSSLVSSTASRPTYVSGTRRTKSDLSAGPCQMDVQPTVTEECNWLIRWPRRWQA